MNLELNRFCVETWIIEKKKQTQTEGGAPNTSDPKENWNKNTFFFFFFQGLTSDIFTASHAILCHISKILTDQWHAVTASQLTNQNDFLLTNQNYSQCNSGWGLGRAGGGACMETSELLSYTSSYRRHLTKDGHHVLCRAVVLLQVAALLENFLLSFI